MGIKDYIGDSFIGQEDIKRKINFFINGHRATGFMPPIMLSASRGRGKSMIARLLSSNLLGSDGKPKKFVEINGSSIKNLRGFVNEIIIPFTTNFNPCTIFIDELAATDTSVLDWLLSMLEVKDNNQTRAFFDGVQYDFSFNHLSFITATTSPEKISEPLKSRCRRLEIEPYKNDDLCKILAKNLKNSGIQIQSGIDEEIAKVSRGSPREIVFLGKDIKQYLAQEKKSIFNLDDWKSLKRTLGINPLGLRTQEIELMRFLKDNGPSTLTRLTGGLVLDSQTLRRDIEILPLSLGLISIETKRFLTQKGLAILNEIDSNIKPLAT